MDFEILDVEVPEQQDITNLGLQIGLGPPGVLVGEPSDRRCPVKALADLVLLVGPGLLRRVSD